LTATGIRLAKDSPLPDQCSLTVTQLLGNDTAATQQKQSTSNQLTPSIQQTVLYPLEHFPLPIVTPATSPTSLNNGDHHNSPTIIEVLTFSDQEQLFPSFGESITRALASIDDGPSHASTPSLTTTQVPARKNIFDRISRLKAVIADDSLTENNLVSSNNLYCAVERLTKTQASLVQSINNLAEQQSMLLSKIEIIIERQPISQSSLPPPVPYSAPPPSAPST
jgi:hypothetical protein